MPSLSLPGRPMAKELEALVEVNGSRLMELPGVGPIVAARVLADVGDVARFADRNRFASWTGTRSGPPPQRPCGTGRREPGTGDEPGRALRGDSDIQRGRPAPAHRHFGSATSRTRDTDATTGPTIASTLRAMGLFPMTHHAECVALLEKSGSDLPRSDSR